MEAPTATVKRQRLSEETIRYANEIKLEAERKLDAVLASAPGTGGQPYQASTGSCAAPVETLADLGIDRKTSARAQKIAALPDETYEAVEAGTITVASALHGHALNTG